MPGTIPDSSAGGISGQSGVALAQDRNASAELEALIPDEALDNPDAWAADGVPPEEPSPIDGPDPFEGQSIELGPDSPLAELPGLTIEWPDPLELENVEQVEDDGTVIQEADSDGDGLTDFYEEQLGLDAYTQDVDLDGLPEHVDEDDS